MRTQSLPPAWHGRAAFFWILSLLWAAGGDRLAGQAWNSPLSSADQNADIALLRRALEHVHPGLTRYATAAKIEAAFAGLAAGAARPRPVLAFYRAVSEACAEIRCGHTRVMAPAIDRYREEHATQLPFTFRVFGATMIVDVVAAPAARLQRGDRVLAIGGRPVATLIAEIGRTVCLDGFTDSVRTSRLDTAYEFADSGFDHYLPCWIGFRDEFVLTVQRGDAKIEIAVPAIGRAAWQRLAPAAKDFADATSWRRLDAETALLEVGTFVNYRRPVDAMQRYRQLFGEIRAAGVDHLIVDLRANGGGSTDVAWGLARFLIRKAIVVSRPPLVRNYRCPADLQKHLRTWEKGVWQRPEAMFRKVEGGYEIDARVVGTGRIEPAGEAFRGRCTVLTSRYNASGSTMLIAALQKLAGVRLVGERTGGAPLGPTAGLLFTLSLPRSGLQVNVPAMRERTRVEGYADGEGVTPDVLVEPTVADFLARRDPVLAAARRPAKR